MELPCWIWANRIVCTHSEDDCRNERCGLTLAQSKLERGASPGQVTADIAKNQTSGLIETFRGSASQTQDDSLTEACVIQQSRKPSKGDILK
jgi:hypothetical protein